MACNGQSTEQVIDSIVSGLSHWNLRPSDNDSFLQIFHHERKAAGCETHGIRAMNDDESIKL